MLIVKIKANDGFHTSEFQSNRQKCWLDGYIAVPKNLENIFMSSGGYCDLVIEGGVLVNIAPRPDYKPVNDVAVLTKDDEIDAMLINQEYKLTLLEIGVSE